METENAAKFKFYLPVSLTTIFKWYKNSASEKEVSYSTAI